MTTPSQGPIRQVRVDALTVRVFATEPELAEAAASTAAEHLRQTLGCQPSAAVILACATSQIRFLEVLCALPGIDWARITLFHMDEYLGIEGTHPASFRRFLRDHVLSRVRPAAAHLIQGDTAEPLKECARYAALLQGQPIDLCCLGVGENGHLAFNDPPVADFEESAAVKLVRLDEACRRQQVGEGCFPSLEAVPMYAFTLTIPTLCAARRMVAVVPEGRKAAAVRMALSGPIQPRCPASILRRQSHCTLFLDAQSAGAWPGP